MLWGEELPPLPKLCSGSKGELWWQQVGRARESTGLAPVETWRCTEGSNPSSLVHP